MGLTGGIFNPRKLNDQKLMIRVVPSPAREFCVPTNLRDRLAVVPRLLFRLAITFLFLAIVCGGVVARANAGNTPATSLGPGLTFAFADLDGDRRPDFASIQPGQNSSGRSDYSIQLYLSQLGRQSIHLVAPVGGLLLEARDVDGDRTIDLVVSTAWRKQPVAIFLNDGHGSFSRAELAAFPRAFSESGTNLLSASNPATDALAISPQPGAGICPEDNHSEFDRSPARLLLASAAGFPPDSFLTSHSGRAPPSAVQHRS